jgi:NADH-quinone oxidoreductase subunit N
MNLGAFAVVARLERVSGSDSLAAVRGFGRQAPIPAAVLALSLLSLAGIPPLAGFAGKVLLLSAALEGGLAWLALVAAANMAIGFYYYVAVIAEMYLCSASVKLSLSAGVATGAALAISLAGTFLLGIVPGAGLEVIAAVSNLME